jgi:exosortase family protein XrtM
MLIRFAVTFLAVFLTLSFGFEVVRDGPVGGILIDVAVLGPAVEVLNTFLTEEHVRLVNRILLSPGAQLHILRGCEGVEMLFLVAAAVLAYPATVRRRLVGVLAGLSVCWIVSVVRVVWLYCTLRFAPGVWEPVHGVVAPLLSVAAAGLYFLVWSAAGRRHTVPVVVGAR